MVDHLSRGLERPPHGRRPSLLLTGLCLLGLLGAGAALADSGITVSSFILHAGPANPPPDQDTTTTWKIEISNNNGVCDERVTMKQKRDILNDYKNQDLAENLRNGRSKFEGFKLSADGTTSMIVNEELEDEKCNGCARPPLTVFFDVTTGENAMGCDFKGFEQDFDISDTGLFCFTCCDSADELPAEPPTPFLPKLTVDAGASANAGGTGTIYGWVSRQVANQIVGQQAKVSAKKSGTCIVGAPDNADTYDNQIDTQGGTPATLPTMRGCYKFENVPFGSYMVRAQGDGSLFDGGLVSVVSSTPLEVNRCNYSGCLPNPSCPQ